MSLASSRGHGDGPISGLLGQRDDVRCAVARPRRGLPGDVQPGYQRRVLPQDAAQGGLDLVEEGVDLGQVVAFAQADGGEDPVAYVSGGQQPTIAADVRRVLSDWCRFGRGRKSVLMPSVFFVHGLAHRTFQTFAGVCGAAPDRTGKADQLMILRTLETGRDRLFAGAPSGAQKVLPSQVPEWCNPAGAGAPQADAA
jgi:hypothetical protein